MIHSNGGKTSDKHNEKALPRTLPVSVNTIRSALLPLYGPVEWRPRYEPLDELIFTVLTQHTSDSNAERAFNELRKRMPEWRQVANADATDIADAIRTGGLANVKAQRIKDILLQIHKLQNNLTLDGLEKRSMQEVREWLMQLPGVGIKTASVVVAFSMGMPAVPVDTHIHRVSRRLGLIGSTTTAEDAHPILEDIVEEDLRFEFHVLLITHGRQICKARRPICGNCPLMNVCPSAFTDR